jgi:hypothetical protein
VLYKGIQIIGYVHLQHWPNQRAAMRIIVIDEAFGNQKYGSYLLGLCERWLKLQGVKSLHVQSSPQAYNFYCQHGYTEMPFDDPLIDIDMKDLIDIVRVYSIFSKQKNDENKLFVPQLFSDEGSEAVNT